MKHALTLLLVFPLLTLVLGDRADARKKEKKGLEPKISKRGKLIFEDDFSKKKLLWTFDLLGRGPAPQLRGRRKAIRPKDGEWRIVKKALAIKSVPNSTWSEVSRKFAPTDNVMIELKALLPTDSGMMLGITFHGGAPRVRGDGPGPPVRGNISCTIAPDQNTISMRSFSQQTGEKRVAEKAFPYGKRRWAALLFEVLDGKYAFTADGRAVEWEQTDGEKVQESSVGVRVFTFKQLQDVVAIDDVKVWEALPKGEEKGGRNR